MKKLLLSIAMFITTTFVFAEGYQVNLQSTKQVGMGHVGAALKLGSESMHFNPAGLAFLESPLDISLGVSPTFATASYRNEGIISKTDNKLSLPMFAYVGFKIYDNLAGGVSLTTPYGSGLNWGKDWVGADLIQNISLQSFSIQPTVSYKILKNLSVGLGMTIQFGDVEISRALMPAGTLTQMGMGDEYKDVIPVSATLKGKSGIRFGYNVGLLWDINDKWSVGASYRSKIMLGVSSGSATLDYASEQIKQILSGKIPPLDEGTFSAEMPMPANLNIGAAFRPNKKLLLSAEIQTVFWAAYKELNITFSEEVLGGYNINSVKNYRNTVIGRVGMEYKLTERFDVRGGLYFDQTPVDSKNLNPETPGMNKIGISAGFSFRPIKKLSIDFALLYTEGIGREGEVSYTNGLQQNKVFKGFYDTYGIIPSVGISYRF